MKSHTFFKKKEIHANDSLELIKMKEKFNAYATHLNTEWENMDTIEQAKWLLRTNELELKIIHYKPEAHCGPSQQI